MARSTPARASDAPRDAIALLKQDHRTVAALFNEFEKADQTEQSSLAERVCHLLTVHAQIEEEILYPAAKEAFGEEEDVELVSEALVEHNSAKELIAKIEGMSADEEEFKATVTVLGEYVKHHVKEEETQLFPKLRKTEVDLKELGSQLADRKFALMEERGIKKEKEAPQQPRRRAAGARAARPSSSRSRSRAGSRSAPRGTSGRPARH